MRPLPAPSLLSLRLLSHQITACKVGDEEAVVCEWARSAQRESGKPGSEMVSSGLSMDAASACGDMSALLVTSTRASESHRLLSWKGQLGFPRVSLRPALPSEGSVLPARER